MSERFAEREAQLVRIESSSEQHRYELRYRVRLFCRSKSDQLATLFMVIHNLFAAGVKTDERKPVSGENERVIGNVANELLHTSQVKAQRVTFGIQRPNADIRSNFLDDLISGEENVICVRVEHELFRCMPLTAKQLERAAANWQQIARCKPDESWWERTDHA